MTYHASISLRYAVLGIFSDMLVNKVTIQSIEVKLTATMASKNAGYKVRNVFKLPYESYLNKMLILTS